jgi:hypothetical protein
MPTTPVQVSPAAPIRQGGIGIPGKAGSQSGVTLEPGDAPQAEAAPAPRSIFQIRQDAYNKALELQAGRKGANVPELMKQALSGAKLFNDAETRERVSLLQAFRDGSMTEAQVFDEMRSRGMQTMPGASLKVVQKPFFEGSKILYPDVEISFQDGRKPVSLDQMAEKLYDSDKLMDYKTKMGSLMLTSSHHGAMEQLAREEAANRRTQSAQNHSETMARINQQFVQNAEMYKLNYSKFQWDKFTQDQARVQGQLERAFGYVPLTEDVRLKLERDGDAGDPKTGRKSSLELAEARLSSASKSVSGAMMIYGMNIDPETLKPNATPAEIQQAIGTLIKSERDNNPDLIKRDEQQRAYVVVGSNKVLVPAPPAPAPADAPAPPPGAVADPAASTKPGIAAPTKNPYVDTTGRPTGVRVPGDGGSVMTDTVAPVVGRATAAATAAASQYMSDAPKQYLQGKISRGEKLSDVETARAKRLGLIK